MSKTKKMDKVLNFPRPEEGPAADADAGMLDRANRTFICTSLFLDIVEYGKKPVSQQLRVKEHFNARLSEALQDIAVNDRIILDTGDGAAINFLGDPEDALFVAISLAQAFANPPENALQLDVRIGINLGPVRLVRDINGQFNIIGDGINVAERVMSFGGTGQVLVSRSYFEVVTRISEDYSQLFAYQGSRTDKHVREHEIYAVASSGAAALDVTARRHRARPALKLIDNTQTISEPPKNRARRLALPYAAAAVSALVLMGAVVYYMSDRAFNATSDAAHFAPAIRLPDSPATQTSAAPASNPEAAKTSGSANPTETGKPAETVKSPTVAKKPARKPIGPVEATAQASAALPAAIKTPLADPPAVGADPSPWKPYKEPKVTPPVPAAEPAVAGSPYTAAAHKPAGALVMLAVSPWGEVMVDGKSAGVSPPLSELELTPGTHHIEIKNGDFTPHLVTLQLESNQTIRIKHKFTQR